MNNTAIDEDTLLTKLRSQSTRGPMRPRLYEIFEFNGTPISSTSFEWMYYAGMGDVDLMAVKNDVHTAAKSLLRKGDLVRTFEEDFWGMKKIRLIQHFDDVKFGYDDKNEVIIYDFMPSPAMPDPVIRPDKTHRSAIARVKSMIEQNNALVDAPVRLNRGGIVRPIVTDKNVMQMRRRQMEFKL